MARVPPEMFFTNTSSGPSKPVVAVNSAPFTFLNVVSTVTVLPASAAACKVTEPAVASAPINVPDAATYFKNFPST